MSANAQSKWKTLFDNTHLFCSGGFGIESKGLGGYTSGTLIYSKHQLKYRSYKNKEFNLLWPTNLPEAYFQEQSVMYGFSIFEDKWQRIAASIGVGKQAGLRRGDLQSIEKPNTTGYSFSLFPITYYHYTSINYNTFTIPYELTLDLTACRYIGVSLRFFGSYNRESSFIGAAATLNVGI